MSLLRLLATGRSLVGMRDGISPYRMCTKNLLPNFGATRNPFLPQAKPEVARQSVCPQPAGSEPLSLFDAELKPLACPGVQAEPLPTAAQEDASQECASVDTPLNLGRMPGSGERSTALLTSCPTKLKVVEPPVRDDKSLEAVKPLEPLLVENLTPARKMEKSAFAKETPLVKMQPGRPAKPTGFSRWLAQLNPWLQFGGWGKVGAKRPARTRPPEQAEFLLAQIKPLRNELNDSDLQVVSTSVNHNEKSPGASSARNAGRIAAGPLNRLGKWLGEDHVQAG